MLPDQTRKQGLPVVGATHRSFKQSYFSETVRANAAAQESANRFNAQVRERRKHSLQERR